VSMFIAGMVYVVHSRVEIIASVGLVGHSYADDTQVVSIRVSVNSALHFLR